jgi:hypothetical protein
LKPLRYFSTTPAGANKVFFSSGFSIGWFVYIHTSGRTESYVGDPSVFAALGVQFIHDMVSPMIWYDN